MSVTTKNSLLLLFLRKQTLVSVQVLLAPWDRGTHLLEPTTICRYGNIPKPLHLETFPIQISSIPFSSISCFVNIHDHVFFYSFTLQPERISGSTYDYSSDIWSLGMSVLECAIGRFPYLESEDQQNPPSFYELLAAIIESPPPTAPSDQFSPEFCSFVSAW